LCKQNKMWRDKISSLFWLVLRLGLFNGFGLFIKIQLKATDSIRIPGVKYPFRLRSGTSDIPTFFQIFLYREYEIDVGIPSIIIDGGANIGLFAILLKNKFPDVKIICVEPDPQNFELLKENLRHYDGIFFEQKGIWNKSAWLKIYDKYNEGKWGMVVEESADQGIIEAISIQDLIDKYALDRIDVLKLDIETSEKQVFSSNYTTWLPRVRLLIIELHDNLEQGCSRAFFRAIVQCFSEFSFSMKGENLIFEQMQTDSKILSPLE
jgi:FkbM family methyltransferase